MSRRRRPQREHFSFDSFLDLVTNVVGIIIRLILVVWAGARTYGSMTAVSSSRPIHSQADKKVRAIHDPLQEELARHRQELAAAQARLLEHLRQVQHVEAQEKDVQGKLAGLAAALSPVQSATTARSTPAATRESWGLPSAREVANTAR